MADIETNNKKNIKKDNQEKDIGITVKKSDDFSEWYQQAILKSEMIEYGPVSGCMIIRPYAYSIWEKVQKYFNKKIKKMGVKNAYFPLLIPENLFNKEKEHVEGFSPEVAWVTHGGSSKLPEKLGIRPTSETIMYYSYSKWIRSWRDLPLKLNQWCNIVRWEFKHPVPFLRTREFLWQEGHTVFATKDEAEKEVLEILNLYKQVFEELYAVPVLAGKKSENEKFAGAVYTMSVETLFPNGKAIQGATSHFLGQNFSKSFNISFLNKEGFKEFAWQNSWGISTRSIGIMIGIHGDDKGVILPPRIAPIHIVIVPILFDDSMDDVLRESNDLMKELSKIQYHNEFIEVIVDDRNYTPGYKYNYWELKGVPIRIELGPKDLKNKQAVIVRRDTNEKKTFPINQIKDVVNVILDEIQQKLLDKAREFINSSIIVTNDFETFKKYIDERKIVYAPFCNNPECEKNIKEMTGSKTLNAPLNNDSEKSFCVACGAESKEWFYFGKSY
ncbi:MAG: proline--tRNA ligase [Candidatus Woesearchaeota archaeon]|nr:MAG: proline--tRNA ligase [Candidatus Woesearchaeota archaeon]